MNKLLECKSIKEKELINLQNKYSKLEKKLKLVIIEIGKFPENQIYLKQKQKLADFLGVEVVHKIYDENISQEEIISDILMLNEDRSITGIMIQKPILKKFNYQELVDYIDYKKDIDGITSINQKLLKEKKELIIPCTVRAILKVLMKYKIDITNKKVVMIGKGNLIGMPLYQILSRKTEVLLCDSKTENMNEKIKSSDIIVTAIGKAHYFKKDNFKKGQVVIDAGTNFLDNHLVGDVDFDSVKDIVSITPVPGGVGQLTTIYLFDNLLILNSISDTNK